MVDVICDTSFLIHLSTRKIKNLDLIYSEIGNIEFVVPLVVLNELEQLTKNQNKQDDAIKTLEFVRDMKNIEISGKFADSAISEYIQKHGGMVATMDEAGFGSCTNTGACSAECPKEIGQINIARLNQEYITSTLAGFLKKKNDRN